MNDRVRWGAATDAGRVRDSNEDAFVAEPMVFAVADGMGGHQAGEVASAMAADIVRERLAHGAPSADVLVAAVVEANAAIFQTARRNSGQMGMGTTLTALAVLANGEGEPTQLALANVGDSRIYLLRSGQMVRATVDHSYVQELLATGLISEEDARNHPRRNIVTRALGIEPTVRVDSWLMPMVRGDRFVLCSDGLVDEIDDDAIKALVVAIADPQAAADTLVAEAVAHGGRDNVTVVVLDVVEGAEPTAVPPDEAATTAIAVEGGSSIEADPPPAAMPTTRRQLTGPTLLFILAVAVVLTVIITLVAVTVSRHNSTPTTTVPPTTAPVTTTSPATAPATTTSPTTTAPTTTALVTTPPTTAGP